MFTINDLRENLFNKEKIKKIIYNKENINSLLIAILIMSGLISFIVDLNNIIPIIILTIFLIIEIINFEETKQRIKIWNYRISDEFLLFFSITIIVFIISIINKGLTYTITDRFIYFLGFVILPFLCLRHDVKINKIINSILMISGILAIPLFFVNFGKYNGGIRMSISYYMLPTYIAMIMTFFTNKNKSSVIINIFKIILFLTLFYPYMFFLVKYISRGVVLAIILCIILCRLINKKKNTRLIIIGILTVLVVLGILLFKPIIIYTNNVLENLNIKVEFISKNAKLLEENNFDNGRDTVYNRTIEGIKEHPIMGNGIGDYAEKYVTYPHNILLQTWYEGGILYCLIYLSILIYSAYILIFDDNTALEKKYLLVLFISISIIRLMLSYEFWRELSFGLYLYTVFDIMQENILRRSKLKNGNNNNSNI